MKESPLTGITTLLGKINESGENALPRLIPLVYEELRRMAAHFIGKESGPHTWQATDLAHEAYHKLLKQEKMTYQNSAHFFAIVAETMRRLLVDYARRKKAKKRGGGWQKMNLDDAVLLQETAVIVDESEEDGVMTEARAEEILQVDDALKKLAMLKSANTKSSSCASFPALKTKRSPKLWIFPRKPSSAIGGLPKPGFIMKSRKGVRIDRQKKWTIPILRGSKTGEQECGEAG
jgi:RNA polymerase sigma factor (TIGR02999 family)